MKKFEIHSNGQIFKPPHIQTLCDELVAACIEAMPEGATFLEINYVTSLIRDMIDAEVSARTIFKIEFKNP